MKPEATESVATKRSLQAILRTGGEGRSRAKTGGQEVEGPRNASARQGNTSDMI